MILVYYEQDVNKAIFKQAELLKQSYAIED